MYQMQQYLEEGYWVSYSRTAGYSPLVYGHDAKDALIEARSV